MISERDAIRLWKELFRGQQITAEMLAEAETVVEGLPLDSPVRVRLVKELEELEVISRRTAV